MSMSVFERTRRSSRTKRMGQERSLESDTGKKNVGDLVGVARVNVKDPSNSKSRRSASKKT